MFGHVYTFAHDHFWFETPALEPVTLVSLTARDRGCSTSSTTTHQCAWVAVPKLRGRLALYDFRWVETWRHLIASCDGLRFRHMDLRGDASCAPILFEACTETRRPYDLTCQPPRIVSNSLGFTHRSELIVNRALLHL